MGWSGYPRSAGDDMTDVSVMSQIWSAYSERRQATGASAATIPVAGDIAFLATDWNAIQAWIEANVGLFVQSHDLTGTPLATNYYDGRSTVDLWTLANLRTAAGLNASGFTRDPGSGVVFGKVVAGDYVLKEQVNEIRACLNLLIWTLAASFTLDTGAGANYLEVGQGGTPGPWANAQLVEAAGYAGGTPSVFSQFAKYTAGKDDGGATNFDTDAVNGFGFLKAASIPTFANSTLDTYAKAGPPLPPSPAGIAFASPVFDDQGSGLTNGTYKLMDAGAPANSSSRTGSQIGDLTFPTWCSDPTGVAAQARGWELPAANVRGILRWNVSGGFVYTQVQAP